MVTNLCFRPTEEFLDRLQEVMAIHHVDKSDAMRIICQEWMEQKKELETFKQYMPETLAEKNRFSVSRLSTNSSSSLQAQKPNDIYCIKDGYWLNPLKIQAKCQNCKLHDFATWCECQRKQSLINQKGE